MNFRMIRHIIGWLLLFECVFLAVPALTAVVYKPPVTALYAREGFVIVAMSWILLSLMGALPLWLSREIPSFVDALFETVSGFTTTGASILPEVERLSSPRTKRAVSESPSMVSSYFEIFWIVTTAF